MTPLIRTVLYFLHPVGGVGGGGGGGQLCSYFLWFKSYCLNKPSLTKKIFYTFPKLVPGNQDKVHRNTFSL